MINLKCSYLSLVELYTSQIKHLKHRSTLFVVGKISIFILFLLSLYIAHPDFSIIHIAISASLLALYLFIYWLDVRCLSQIEHLNRKRAVVLNEISYLEGNFSMFNDGEEYIDTTHAYSYDLDLFGVDSLFARINRTITKRGERLLAYRFTHLIDQKEGILLFGEAIDELKEMTDWRIEFLSQPFIYDNIDSLSQSIIKRNRLGWLFSPYFAGCSVALTLISLILGALDIISFTPFATMFILQVIIATILSRRVSHTNINAENMKSEFRGYHDILRLISTHEFTSTKLKAIHHDLFKSDNSSSRAFAELSRILNMFDQRNSEFSYTLLNGLFLFDIFITLRFNRWMERYLPYMDIWIESIAQIDMLTSLANYAYNNPSNVKPQLIDDIEGEESGSIIEAEQMFHPFIWRKSPVANDFILKRGNISIITGANMAGKSTFLRTVGVNYILACCGAPVAARSFRFSLVTLFSSMRTTDNLSKDISYFNAELLRLGQLIEHVRTHKHTLIILDEILKGTNSKDKLEGSVMFLNEISSYNVSGIIATHDLELSKLEQSAGDKFNNYCFEIELSDDITYSYKISRGVSKNMNATFLLKNILRKFTLIFILLLSLSQGVLASSDTIRKAPTRHQFELNVASAQIFKTSNFFKTENLLNKPMDRAISYHAKYGFRLSETSRLGRLYPHTYQGIGVALFDFYNENELGTPISVYLYQGSPLIFFSRRFTLDYEWNFGASFNWKFFDADYNPMNTVVGSRINAYLNLGLYFNWIPFSHLKLKFGADASHFSNGNTKYPNGGVNTFSLRGGLVYCFNSYREPLATPSSHVHHRPYWSYDFMIFGAKRFKGITERSYLLPDKYLVAGFNFAPMYSFNKHFKAGISLDGDYDESANLENFILTDDYDSDDEIVVGKQPFNERISLGLSTRLEFVMPIFSINLGLGNDILNRGDHGRGFYQILALKSSITRNLYINVGYKLHDFHMPKNLMIGVGVRFNNKY